MPRLPFCPRQGTNAAVPSVPDGPVEPQGLPDDVVDALFFNLKRFSRLAVAVSGGADSLCLMTLLAEWKQRSAWLGQLEVLCVDHGLRPESGAEAAFVAECAEEHGLDCAILRWTGVKPDHNLQEEARLARYRLMAEHMAKSGAEALLLGHHLDDQAETFLDRLTRGSGVAGLSAMAADDTSGPGGLRLLRPLLTIEKTRLEASLTARGRTWCTDPSNKDDRYKRSRLRSVLALLAQEGLTAERLARTADNMRRAGEALQATLQDLAEKYLVEHAAGPLKLERAVFRAIPEELRLRLITLMIARVTGGSPRPRLRSLTGLNRMLSGDRPCRLTLAGAVFEAGPETVCCWKERGRTPPETLVGLNGRGVWDNRYAFSVVGEPGQPAGNPLQLGPLSDAPVSSKEIDWPKGWPKAAFDCAPAVWCGERVVMLHALTAAMEPGTSHREGGVTLERLPIHAKLLGNYVDDGDAAEEN